VQPGDAVHLPAVVGLDFERRAVLALPRRTPRQERIERPLPGPRMERRRPREDAIEIQDRRQATVHKVASRLEAGRKAPGNAGRPPPENAPGRRLAALRPG